MIDEEPIPEMNSEVFDFLAAFVFFAVAQKLTPFAFRSPRLTMRCQGRDVPPVGGYVLFGKDRFDLFGEAG